MWNDESIGNGAPLAFAVNDDGIDVDPLEPWLMSRGKVRESPQGGDKGRLVRPWCASPSREHLTQAATADQCCQLVVRCRDQGHGDLVHEFGQNATRPYSHHETEGGIAGDAGDDLDARRRHLLNHDLGFRQPGKPLLQVFEGLAHGIVTSKGELHEAMFAAVRQAVAYRLHGDGTAEVPGRCNGFHRRCG